MFVRNALRILIPDAAIRQLRFIRKQYQCRRNYGPVETRVQSLFALVRRWVAPLRTVLYYPDLPDEYQVVFKLCVVNCYRMTSNPFARHDAVQKHIKTTSHDRYEILDHLPLVLNRDCRDISKVRVQNVFEEVFRYSLEINPLQHVGPAVRKSDANYAHDGVIIECPLLSKENEGIVYQRFVDTESEDGFCIDHRVPIYGSEIPLVYLKYKPAANRFHSIDHAEIVNPSAVFAPEERQLLLEFSRAMGLDFGELDVLRDRYDGRIFVVDVNNTPAGPRRGLTPEQRRYAAGVLAGAYHRLVQQFAESRGSSHPDSLHRMRETR